MAEGRTVTVTWRGRAIEAFVPVPLEPFRVDLPERVIRATERAVASLRRADDRLHPRFESLARLLLRAEGVASSHIEGLRAPAELVVVGQFDVGAVDATSAWVADNLAVVDDSLAHARSGAALAVDDLHRWHARLMEHGGLPDDLVGRFRGVQNWVGGATPREAAFVPPPPEHVDGLMRDLLGFVDASRLDPVSLAAVIHAQFETIHPYGDGNGRLGRVLIGWVLARRSGVAVPPPVSVAIARDIGGYLSGLARWRQGDVAGWVGWVAEAVSRSSDDVVDLIARVEGVRSRWRTLVSDLRADAAALRLLEILPQHLVVTAPMVADLVGVSAPAARGAIEALAARGILEPLQLRTVKPGRPAQWWMAGELVSLLRV